MILVYNKYIFYFFEVKGRRIKESKRFQEDIEISFS